MSTGLLPRLLDPRKLANQGGAIRGQMSVGELPRLREFPESQDEPVAVELVFSRDEQGHHCVHGSVDTRLAMQCQRCLEPVTLELAIPVILAMAWGNDQMKALPPEYDPWLITADQVPLADLLEEEILLALPAVAVHEHCPHDLVEENAEDPSEDEAEPEKENPFAVLAQLKKGDSEE